MACARWGSQKSCRLNDRVVLTGPCCVFWEFIREKQANAEAGEVVRFNPNFSLDRWTETLVCKEQAEIDRSVDALRKTGLK
jgi:hypothetical protein